jgi:hypothetical protein
MMAQMVMARIVMARTMVEPSASVKRLNLN